MPEDFVFNFLKNILLCFLNNNKIIIQLYQFKDFELTSKKVGTTTRLGKVTPPEGCTMKNLLSYEVSKLGSEDVNYGAFEVASDTGNIFHIFKTWL